MERAKIVTHRSSSRGTAGNGLRQSFYTFKVGAYNDSPFESFGCLRVLNEDLVQPQSGFPMHPHRNMEIFSYILEGELTHRDSTVSKHVISNTNKKQFYRMKRHDVQFTSAGTGVYHSEMNESEQEVVRFLQIWVQPWKQGLMPQYHTTTFDEKAKRQAFLPIISPLAAGRNASDADESAAIPVIPRTIPIHADLVVGVGIISADQTFKWTVGAGDQVVGTRSNRNIYIHMPGTQTKMAKIRLSGSREVLLDEGDGAFITNVNVGDEISVQSIGSSDAEVIVLDSS